MQIFALSAKTGAGVDEFLAFLRSQQAQLRATEAAAQSGALRPSA